MLDKIVWILVAVVIFFAFVFEARTCGKTTIQTDEGVFTATKRMFGGEPIYRETDTTWWVWADELNRKMKICHNCKIIDIETK